MTEFEWGALGLFMILALILICLNRIDEHLEHIRRMLKYAQEDKKFWDDLKRIK